MTFFTCASRTILIIFNVIFAIVGLGLAVGGGVLAWNYALIAKLLNERMFSLIQQSGDEVHRQEAIKTLVKSLTPLGLGIFIAGMIIMAICVLGLIGAICYKRCVLAIYLALHATIWLAEIVMIIIYGVRQNLLTDPLKNLLVQSASRYVSLNSTDTDSILMNAMMISLNCCGANNGEDFKGSTNFQQSYTVNGVPTNVEYPPACCKRTAQNTPVADCPTTFTTANSNKDTGCWGILKTEFDRYGNYIMYAAIGIAVFQFLLVIACFILLCTRPE